MKKKILGTKTITVAEDQLRRDAIERLKQKKAIDSTSPGSVANEMKRTIASKSSQSGTPNRRAKRNTKPMFKGGIKKNVPGVFGQNQGRGYNPDNKLTKGLKSLADSVTGKGGAVSRITSYAKDLVDEENQISKIMKDNGETEIMKKRKNLSDVDKNQKSAITSVKMMHEADKIKLMEDRRKKRNKEYEALYK